MEQAGSRSSKTSEVPSPILDFLIKKEKTNPIVVQGSNFDPGSGDPDGKGEGSWRQSYGMSIAREACPWDGAAISALELAGGVHPLAFFTVGLPLAPTFHWASGVAREAHISAVSHQTPPQPRVPLAHGYARWARGALSPSSQGSQAAHADHAQQALLISTPRSTGEGTLPKARRLRKSVDFKRVQSRGSTWRGRWLVSLHLPSQGVGPRLGLVVSRRVGNAVVRNRVKRRLREAARRQLGALPAVDWVLIARTAAGAVGYASLASEVARAASHILSEEP